jgi:paraquat-inducible protein A
MLVRGLLAVAAVGNVIALMVPFLDVDMAGSSSQPYGLLRTVELLWESGLYVLALLVVGFSAVFPFVKLSVLWSCTARGPASGRLRRLALVETMGKWSMLDALLVAILLALTQGQWMISAEPRWGITIFVTAIVLSMAAGTLVAGAWHPAPAPSTPTRPRPPTQVVAWLLAMVAGITLLGAQLLPTLHIDSFWLADRTYNLVDITTAMATQGAWSLAGLLMIGCLVLPWAVWGCLVWSLLATHPEPARRWSARLRGWTLVDVFALSLAIFLLEGSEFVPTGTGPGAALLVAFLVFHLLARWALARTLRPTPA